VNQSNPRKSAAKKKSRSPFYRLVDLYARLRAPGGCPWDRAQSHASLKPYLIEEAYEVVEAIEEGDYDKMMEELGDLLGQVIFHSQLAKERGSFDIDRIIEYHRQKMERRHPHIFGKAKVDSVRQVLENWEQIKRREKDRRRRPALYGVPRALPALLRARRVQEKADRLGWQWEELDRSFAFFEKLLSDLSASYSRRDRKNFSLLLGRFLFLLVNISRMLEIDPEDSLRRTTGDFIKKFHRWERRKS
jgi:tetrapyrrole methylase family protein/MazG family protein